MRARLWLWPAGLALLALAGAPSAPAGERGAAQRTAGTTEGVDAEMLRDLDLLESPDHVRDLPVAHRMNFFERLRMLETQRAQEPAGAPPPTPPPSPVKDAR